MRNEQGHLLGFPNWTPGKTIHNDENCLVSINFPRGGLGRVEIDTLIRQGNSGGPLVDAKYRLAGIAQQGATQAHGNNECLCVSEIVKWLADLDLVSVASTGSVD